MQKYRHTHTLRANEKNGLYFDDDVFNGAFFSTNFEHMYGWNRTMNTETNKKVKINFHENGSIFKMNIATIHRT